MPLEGRGPNGKIIGADYDGSGDWPANSGLGRLDHALDFISLR